MKIQILLFLIFTLRFLYSFGPQKTVEQCLENVKNNPASADAYVELGDAYLRNEDFENAKKSYEKALSLNSKKADAYYGLSQVFYKLKDYKSALEYALIAENLMKFKAQYKSQVGLIYYKLNEIENATNYFKTAIAISSGKKGFYYSMLGNCYIKLGKYNEAIEMFNKVLEEKPWDKRVYADIARAYYKAGNKSKGDEYRILAGDQWRGMEEPEEEKYSRSKGWQFYSEKNYDEAIKIFIDDSKKDPKNPDPILGLAYSYYKKEQLDKALSYADKAVKVAPDYYRCFSARAFIYEKTGKIDKAIIDYQKALELNSDDKFSREQLAKILYKNKDYINAEINLKAILEYKPNDTYFLKMLGNTLIELKKYNEAYKIFLDALKYSEADEKDYIKKRYAYAAYMYAEALEKENKIEESKKIYKEISEIAPETEYGTLAIEKIKK